MENYIRNHPEQRLERIQSLGKKLVDDHIMAETTQADVEAITTRWSQLSQQVIESFIKPAKTLFVTCCVLCKCSLVLKAVQCNTFLSFVVCGF